MKMVTYMDIKYNSYSRDILGRGGGTWTLSIVQSYITIVGFPCELWKIGPFWKFEIEKKERKKSEVFLAKFGCSILKCFFYFFSKDISWNKFEFIVLIYYLQGGLYKFTQRKGVFYSQVKYFLILAVIQFKSSYVTII